MTHFFIEGGPGFMIAITVSWITMLLFSGLKIFRMVKKQEFDLQLLNYILLFGSLSFMLGVLGLGIGLSQAMNAIYHAGDISISLIAEGIRVSMITPIYGFIFFMISLCIWAILKEINLKKMLK